MAFVPCAHSRMMRVNTWSHPGGSGVTPAASARASASSTGMPRRRRCAASAAAATTAAWWWSTASSPHASSAACLYAASTTTTTTTNNNNSSSCFARGRTVVVVAAAAGGQGGGYGGARRSGSTAKLVNVRVAPRKKRRRARLDEPTRVDLGNPSDPSFDSRLTNAINCVYGPNKLGKLVDDYGAAMTPYQLGCALALSAGFAAGRTWREMSDDSSSSSSSSSSRGGGDDDDNDDASKKQRRAQERVDACRALARRCAQLLAVRLDSASALDCARAAYSLSRLRLRDPALLSAMAAHTTGRLSGAAPEALAGLAVGLALGGCRPPDEWLREWRVESFAALPSCSAAELANAAFALATWREAPSDVWLARWAQALRQRWGARGGCPPPALVRAAYSLAAMPPARPVPVTLLLAERQAAAQSRGASASSSAAAAAAAAAAAERVPSFNWLCGLTGAARLCVDALSPGELSALLWSLARLGHSSDSDPLFCDAWYRAAAAKMASFGPAEMALAMHSLGMLRPGVGVPGGVPGRFVRELLPALRRTLGRMTGPQLSRVLWGLGELRLWPGRGWIDDWLAAAEPRLAAAGAAPLADAAWALARLGARDCVPASWVAALVAAVDGALLRDDEGPSEQQQQQQQQQQPLAAAAASAADGLRGGSAGGSSATTMPHLGGSSLVEQAAAVASASSSSPSGSIAAEAMMATVGLDSTAPAGATGSAVGGVDSRCLAVLIWSLSRLGHRPPRAWLVAFKARAAAELGEEGAQRLARFIAGALMASQGPAAAV